MRLALAVMLFALPAQAAPLEMRYLRSENLHIANQGGAINWLDEVKLVLDLAPDGTLTGVETGKTRKHDLYRNNWTAEDVQRWTNRWSGTWKQTTTALDLDVGLESRSCTHTKTRSGEKPQQLACGAVAKLIHFTCTTEKVPLLAPTPAGGMRPTHEVWQCRPTGTVALDRTPTPWTFAKTGCVKTLGGRRGFGYETC